MTLKISDFVRLTLLLAAVDCALVLIPHRWSSPLGLSVADTTQREITLLFLYNLIAINIIVSRRCYGVMVGNTGAARGFGRAFVSISGRSLLDAFLWLALIFPACAIALYLASSALHSFLRIMPSQRLYSEKVITLTAALICLAVMSRVRSINSALPGRWLALTAWVCVALILTSRFEYLDVRGDWLMYNGITYALLLTGMNTIGLICRPKKAT